MVHSATPILPSYNYYGIKLVSVTFIPRISFVIVVGEKDIRKIFVLPSS